MTHSFRRLVVPALIIVACGSDTIAPPEATPGEGNVFPGLAQGGTRAAATDATGGKSSREAHGGTSAAKPNGSATGGADSNGSTEPDEENPGAGGGADESEELELPPGWTPAELGPNGPAAWYVASTSPNDYQVIPAGTATWFDRTQNNWDLTQPTSWAQPQLVPTGWNGTQPTLRFNGGNLLRLENWSVPPIGTDAGFAVLAVMRSAAPQHAGIASWWSEWGDGVWAAVRSTSGLTLLDYHRLDDGTFTQMHSGDQDLGCDPDLDTACDQLSGTGLHVVAWRFSSSTQTATLTVDGAHSVSTPQPPVGNITAMPFIVGALSPLPTGFFKGDISELVIVGDQVSDEDVQYFTEYARNTWSGLPAGPGSGPCIKADGQPSPDTIRCDDGNPDTFGDHCSAGSCVGNVPAPGSPKELSPVAWYYAAESEVVITYDGVSTWYDRSPERRDLMNGYWARPDLVADGWDVGKPTVQFAANALKRLGWTGTPTGTEAAFTVLAVMRSDVASQNSGVVSWFHPTGYGQVAAKIKPSGGVTALDLYRLDNFLNTQEYLGNIGIGTTRHAVAWRYADGVVKLTVDGLAQTEQRSPIGAIPSDAWFFMGIADGFGGGQFSGDVSELAVIPRSITDTEVARFSDYAVGEWGGFTVCVPNCAGQPYGGPNGCGGTCDGPGNQCDDDSDCDPGLICWLEGARHFDKPGGTGVCAPPICQTNIVLGGCGDLSQPCGRCESTPRPCTTNADCVPGEVCGTNNGAAFGLAPDGDFCWPPDCNTPATTTARCGSVDSACGICDCSANCIGRECGDGSGASDHCFGICPNICDDRQAGCASDLECPAGSYCASEIGGRFGFDPEDNVCIPLECAGFDPSLPGCGVDSNPACGPCVEEIDCTNRECGANGQCGSCPAGATCSLIGQCVPIGRGDRPPTPLPPSLPQESTSAVGALPGEISVTDRGSANYRIPLDLPEARLDFAPDLALEYLSTRRDGYLGVGWRLDGLSAISRCPKIVDLEGATAPITYTAEDSFCWDGKRLVRLADGTYRTEIDSFSKIVAVGEQVDESGTPVGPDYFEVYEPAGRVLKYGVTDRGSVSAGARLFGGGGTKRIWALETIEDRSGNAIRIDYKTRTPVSIPGREPRAAETAELVPEFIRFNKLDPSESAFDATYDSWVSFSYESRPDIGEQYTAGAAGFALLRMKTIEVAAAGTPVRRYNLDYEEPLGESRLSAIRDCAVIEGGNEVCKPATVLTYFEEMGFEPATELSLVTPFGVSKIDAVLDFNGDGQDDLLVRWASQTGRQIMLANTDRGSPLHFTLGETIPSTSEIESCFPLDKRKANTSDINRDGREDLVCEGIILESQPSGFVPSGFGPGPTNPSRSVPQIADLNGDGLQDIIACGSFGQNYGIRVYYNDSRGGGGTASGPGLCSKLLVLDADGDGVEDILSNSGGSQFSMLKLTGTELVPDGVVLDHQGVFAFDSQHAPHKILDFNGDGLKDLISGSGSGLYVWLNTGKGFTRRSFAAPAHWTSPTNQILPAEQPIPGFPLPTWPTGVNDAFVPDLKNAMVVDFDGDGRDDIIAGRPRITGDPVHTYVFRSTSLGFQLARVSADPSLPSDPRLGAALGEGAWDPLEVLRGDFDGDGAVDVVTASSEVSVTLHRGRSRRNWLLGSIRDGLGKVTTLAYDQRSGADVFSDAPMRTYSTGIGVNPRACYDDVNRLPWEPTPLPGDAPKFVCTRKAGPLVSEHRVFEEGKPGLRFLHSYHAGRQGLLGRGPFGFAQRITHKIDDANSIVTTTHVNFLNHRFDLAGRAWRTDISAVFPQNPIAPLHQYLRRIDNTWERQISGSGLPFIVRRERRDQELANNQPVFTNRQTAAFIDEWGNTTTEVTTALLPGNAVPQQIRIDTPVTANTEDWLLRLPDSMAVTDSRVIRGRFEHQTRTTTFTYYPTGLLHTYTREPNDFDQKLVRTLVRDEWGNITTMRREDASGNTRESHIVFDGTKISPVSIVDAADFRTDLRFDPLGALVTVRDPRLLVEQRAYDAFGRLRRVVTPTGERTYAYHGPRHIDQAPFGGFDTASHLVTTITGGETVERDYDAFGRMVRIGRDGFEGQDVIQEFHYDWAGRLVRSEQPHVEYPFTQGGYTYEYDDLDRRIRITLPDGSVEARHYAPSVLSTVAGAVDSRSVLAVAVVKPKTGVTLTSFDHTGVPARVVEVGTIAALQSPPVGTRYGYGPFRALWQVLDVNNVETSNTTDRLGRVLTQDDPASGHREYTHNAFDEITTHVDGNGQFYSYEYDELSRLRFVRTAVDTVAEFQYDQGQRGRGKMTSMWRQSTPGIVENGVLVPGSAAGSWVRFEYEALGRLEHVVHEIAGEQTPFVTSFDYDQEVPWQVETIHYPNSANTEFSIVHEYDGVGHLKAIRGPDGEAIWQLVAADQGLRPAVERFGNGVETVRDYFAYPFGAASTIPECNSSQPESCFPGRINAIRVRGPSGSPLHRIEYHYDRNGNASRRLTRDSEDELVTETFTYDEFNQLDHHDTVAADPARNFDYEYDADGNLDSVSESGGTEPTAVETYHYDDATRPYRATRLVRGNDTTTYGYDGNGNQTARSGPKVVGGTQSLSYNEIDLPWQVIAANGTTRYEYDATGTRLLRRTPTTTTDYVGEIYERRRFDNDPSTIEHRYRIYALGSEVANVIHRDHLGTIMTTKQYLHNDALGSIALVTHADGDIIETRDLSGSFGASSAALPLESGIEAGFTGHQHEDALGLISMRGRFYDPKFRRFVSPDPFVTQPFEKVGRNRYAYVNNNPLTLVDPTGFYTEHETQGTPTTMSDPDVVIWDPCGGGGCGDDTGSGTDMGSEPTGGGTPEVPGDGGPGGGYDPTCNECSGAPTGGGGPDQSSLPTAGPDSESGGPGSAGSTDGVGGGAPTDPGCGSEGYQCGPDDVPGDDADFGGDDGGEAPPESQGRGIPPPCFAAGTKVLMASGITMPIEEIRDGDAVLADDPLDPLGLVARTVGVTYKGLTHRLFHIWVDGPNGGEIVATGAHPFWTQHGWVNAEDLSTKDLLKDDKGRLVAIRSIEVEFREARTYNLAVDRASTYFVVAGSTPVLVHNWGFYVGNSAGAGGDFGGGGWGAYSGAAGFYIGTDGVGVYASGTMGHGSGAFVGAGVQGGFYWGTMDGTSAGVEASGGALGKWGVSGAKTVGGPGGNVGGSYQVGGGAYKGAMVSKTVTYGLSWQDVEDAWDFVTSPTPPVVCP